MYKELPATGLQEKMRFGGLVQHPTFFGTSHPCLIRTCLICISKSRCSKENGSTIAFRSCWHVLHSPHSHRFVKFVELVVNNDVTLFGAAHIACSGAALFEQWAAVHKHTMAV